VCDDRDRKFGDDIELAAGRCAPRVRHERNADQAGDPGPTPRSAVIADRDSSIGCRGVDSHGTVARGECFDAAKSCMNGTPRLRPIGVTAVRRGRAGVREPRDPFDRLKIEKKDLYN
jgi:hypothetical protein